MTRILARAAASGLSAGVLLVLAGGATAAGWTRPAVIPTGAGATPLSRPAIRANTTGVLVAGWQRGRDVYAAARFFGGPWSRPRRIATAADGEAPQLVSGGATVALGVVAGPSRTVRIARWGGAITPAVGGPAGARGARDLRLVALRNREVVAVFGRGGGVAASALAGRGAWTAPQRLFPNAAGVSLAPGPGGDVLATSLRTSARGTSVVAALRSARQPFGPASVSPSLGRPGSVVSVAAAIRQDGRTGLVVGLSRHGGLVALAAGAREKPVGVSAPGASIAGRVPAALGLRRIGGLVTAWRQAEGGRLRLYSARESDPGGGSWEPPLALTPRAARIGAPVIEGAPDGRTILAYAVDGAIYVRTLTADGLGGWSAARRINGAATACAFPSVAFDTARRAVVAFACGRGKRLLAVTER